jgi:gliding motility-associated protein GldM
MAGGKLSARQKMINLMYLVFIAMLAMNMSKEVLSAFGYTNEKLEANNSFTSISLNNLYSSLKTKAISGSEVDKYRPLYDKAEFVRKSSDSLYAFVAALKDSMLSTISAENLNSEKKYEYMDSPEWLNQKFFKNGKISDEGNTFLSMLTNYRDNLIKITADTTDFYKKFQVTVAEKFETNDVKRKGKAPQNWLNARYEGMPMVSSLTNFTQIQSDIRTTESSYLDHLLGDAASDGNNFSNFNGIVKLDKYQFFPGEKVTGTIVLGKEDPTLKPTRVVLDGKAYDNYSEGAVNLDLTADRTPGKKNIEGTIYFIQDGKEKPITFKSSYSVVNKPNAAIVSADKMKVVYKGISNPISVALPGVPDKDIRIRPSGHESFDKNSKSPGKYNLMPSKAATEVVLDISARLSDGTIITDRQKIRTKDIPAAQLLINGKAALKSMQKSALTKSVFTVGMVDFDFDLNITTTEFQVVIDGRSFVIPGTTLTSKAKDAINSARKGTMISFNQVEAVVTGNSYKLKKIFGTSVRIR